MKNKTVWHESNKRGGGEGRGEKKKGEDEEGRRERRVDGIPVPSYRICKGAHTQ